MKTTTIIIVAILIVGGIYIQLTSDKKLSVSKETNFENLGPAPEFVGIEKWLNSDPLTTQGLRGKVVLIDFWTYSCINCIRTLPYVTKWYDTYKDQGLIVVGVHTPEFAFEKITENVQTAVERHQINYPVAQDNDYQTWRAYDNRYWPAEYLIDQSGNVVYTHFGEGAYDKTENAIRVLLGLDVQQNETAVQNPKSARSPEMYFGLNRLQNLTFEQQSSSTIKSYTFPEKLYLNNFALEGTWQFYPDHLKLTNPNGKIRLRFQAAKVHFVAQSPTPVLVEVRVDGQRLADVVISGSGLYTLFDSTERGEHTLELLVPQEGLEAFTFTFG